MSRPGSLAAPGRALELDGNAKPRRMVAAKPARACATEFGLLARSVASFREPCPPSSDNVGRMRVYEMFFPRLLVQPLLVTVFLGVWGDVAALAGAGTPPAVGMRFADGSWSEYAHRPLEKPDGYKLSDNKVDVEVLA